MLGPKPVPNDPTPEYLEHGGPALLPRHHGTVDQRRPNYVWPWPRPTASRVVRMSATAAGKARYALLLHQVWSTEIVEFWLCSKSIGVQVAQVL